MKLFLGSWLLVFLFTGPGEISRINTLKSEAKKAYNSGDFKTAIEKYKYLIDSLGVKEDEVMMNLSNAYFRSKDTANASGAYQPLTLSGNAKIKSQANLQLGVLATRQRKFEEALDYFKQSLNADPTNEEARYNYELVKKKLEEKKKQQQKQDQNKKDNKDQKKDDKDKKDNKDQKKDQKDKKDQQDKKDQKDKKDQQDKDKHKQEKDQKDKQDQKDKKDQKDQKDKKDQNKDQQDKDKQEKQKEEQNKNDKDKKDIPPSVSEKLKDMKMSEDKAKMILEAMKNQEVQYLQQNKRKATKPRESGKPDW